MTPSATANLSDHLTLTLAVETYSPSRGWLPLLTGALAEKAADAAESARLAALPVRVIVETTGEVIPETALPTYERWQDEQVSERVLLEAERAAIERGEEF